MLYSPCRFTFLFTCLIWLSNQEGASKEEIDQLSKFKFQKNGDNEKPAGDVQGPVGGIMIECGTDSPMEQVLSQDDAVSWFHSLSFPCLFISPSSYDLPDLVIQIPYLY